MKVYEFILASLLLLSFFFLLVFIWVKFTAKFSRLFKRKSHHYIVRPTPKNDSDWYPIAFSNYDSFIFIKDADENYIGEKLNLYFESKNLETDNAHNPIAIDKIELNKHKTWLIFKINKSSFGDFKTLVWWLDDVSEVYQSPTSVIGFCQQKNKPLKDYLFKTDKWSDEDDFIGSFRTGKNFGIYFPNIWLNESGNISLSKTHEINFYYELSKLPIEYIEKPMISCEKLIKHYRQQRLISHKDFC